MIIDSSKGTLTYASQERGAGLAAALGMTPTALIEFVKESGLKGRGGAGFTTGLKWQFAAAAPAPSEAAATEAGTAKYVVCNADEGEPGTFKDRVILTDHADLVFEGMTIAGYAIGAKRGVVYLRGEYTYLVPKLKEMLRARRDEGLLGSNVMGKEGFGFDIEIRMGSGAYVCGEETALIESLEGHRGEPRNRPPFPVDTGLGGKATTVNNVETLAWVPLILSRGAEWWKSLGTERSSGLKLFSVSGDCAAPGVYEFPFGLTVADLLKAVGGGDAKAVQVGGASGTCVPAKDFGRRIAFEDLSTGGSVIVFGPQRDMLQVAKNFMEFFVEESCGQCTPCREGNEVLLEGIEMLEYGECSTSYLKELVKLGETMQIASKCGLGQSSPNAFLSIVENFRDELMGRTVAE
ncbi:MAG: dehydrogenase [Gaiellales bacterium]|nr:dehydrogenase [Gaiellales bacterium]